MDSKDNRRIREEWHGGVCSHCGGGGTIVAHHIEPKHDKRGVPSDFTNEAALLAELDLCAPLCIRCHIKLHKGTLDIPPA
jgi:hypothetical protein